MQPEEEFGHMPNFLESSMLVRSFRVFDAKVRVKLYFSIVIQSLLAILDLFGIAIVGLIGAMSVRGIQSQSNPGNIDSFLAFLNIEDFSFQLQVFILAGLSTTMLLTKTIISIFVIRRIYFFMSLQSAQISKKLLDSILSQPLSFISTLTSNKILYSTNAGCSRIALGITGNYISLISDGFLLTILFGALILVDPGMTLFVGLFFSIVIIFFHQFIKHRAENVGKIESKLNIESNQQVLEGLSTYRERYTNNSLGIFTEDFLTTRVKLSQALAESSFLPNITKYVIESLVLIGALIVCGIQFAVHDSAQAIATLSIFLAAATRVTPAIMRVQQSFIQIRTSSGAALQTLELIERFRRIEPTQTQNEMISLSNSGSQELLMREVNYRYPGANTEAVSNLNLDLFQGESIALVGPSGGGKSTIADLILGIAEPETGVVQICGQSPKTIISNTQGFIGYVPQETSLISGNVRTNLLMGLDPSAYSDEHLSSILELVGLKSEFQALKIDLDSSLGDKGSKLSGGQKQRLGIARALIPSPRLLILDEATSSLDASSENIINRAIRSLKGKISIVVIAHRLSSIRDVSRIYYIKNGAVVAAGSFEELRNNLEEFRVQTEIMGL